MKNPALRRETRYEPAVVSPLKQESSLIDWLKATNRLIPRENQEVETTVLEEEEISDLMDGDDSDYDDLYDDAGDDIED